MQEVWPKKNMTHTTSPATTRNELQWWGSWFAAIRGSPALAGQCRLLAGSRNAETPRVMVTSGDDDDGDAWYDDNTLDDGDDCGDEDGANDDQHACNFNAPST